MFMKYSLPGAMRYSYSPLVVAAICLALYLFSLIKPIRFATSAQSSVAKQYLEAEAMSCTRLHHPIQASMQKLKVFQDAVEESLDRYNGSYNQAMCLENTLTV
jgi:hypothetical protein